MEREEGAGVMSTLDATMELMFEGCIHLNSLMLPSSEEWEGEEDGVVLPVFDDAESAKGEATSGCRWHIW